MLKEPIQIRLFKPHVGPDEMENIRMVFERAWLGLGPMVEEFEQAWSIYIGVPSSIGVNSATAALHLALTAYHFPPGSKVLVPAITFVSTALAALYNHLEPVFVDVDPETLSLCLQDLQRKIDKKCVAIIPVHLGGHPVPMDQLIPIARANRLVVIEDCAHCAGGSYRGRKLGTWGDIGCFSFEEKKCMTTGDGGMISALDSALIEPLRAYRWVGIDKDTWKRSTDYIDAKTLDARHWYYEVAVLGYKYNMNDLMAAIGLAQLKKLDWMNSRRLALIQRYLDGIKSCRGIRPLWPYEFQDASYWIFGVRCAQRDELMIHLKQKGIASGVHFLPLPLHPLFRSHREAIPIAARVWKTMLTLPLFPDLTEEEVDYIIDALIEFDRNSFS